MLAGLGKFNNKNAVDCKCTGFSGPNCNKQSC